MLTLTLAAISLSALMLPQTGTQEKKDAAPEVQITFSAPGKGASPADGDVVTVAYTLTLKGDSKVIDSSVGSAPFAFKLGNHLVIPGFEQGIKSMKPGSKAKVTIPPTLGYGKDDHGPIPGNSTLTFDIELLRVDKKNAKPSVTTVTTQKGTGAKVKKGDLVTIHYVGTFINDHKFDSSRDTNKPFSFQAGVGSVVPGFDQAVVGMQVGEIKKVTIPYQLGYGENGSGEVIPPFSTLVFEIELLKIGN